MKHSKYGEVVWFNRTKGFGEYQTKGQTRFFTLYDVKKGTPSPGTTIELKQTRCRKIDGSYL